MTFSPHVGDSISIGQVTYRFTEHPAAKGMPYGQTGRRATVYQVQAQDGTFHALKVFTQAFRASRHAGNAERLRPFAAMPGLETCQRIVITPTTEQKLVKAQPDLEFAVLMPWIHGETWQEFLLSGQVLSRQQCLSLARSLVSSLAAMEGSGIAHCDLAGPNVMIDAPTGNVALVDVDDLYAPTLPRPEKLPGGSPGYAHKTAPQGLWSPEADRFAAAILLAEMLTWHDPVIRQQAFGEQFFDPAEMQTDCPRFVLMLQTLQREYGETIAAAFRRAWESDTLAECPRLAQWSEWLNALSEAPVSESEMAAPLSTASSTISLPDNFTLPTFQPVFKPIEESDALPAAVTLPAAPASAASQPVPVSPSHRKSASGWAWALAALFALAALVLGGLYLSAVQDRENAQSRAWRLENELSNARSTMQALENELRIDRSFFSSLTNWQIAYGPQNGSLSHVEDDFIEVECAGVSQRNFVTGTVFSNPYAASYHAWDYGFLFRDTGGNQQYRLALHSDRTWDFGLREGDNWTFLGEGEVPDLNVGDGQQNSLVLRIKGNGAEFWVNGHFISTLDVADKTVAGDVCVATGIWNGDEVNGKTTRFSNFVVYSIP